MLKPDIEALVEIIDRGEESVRSLFKDPASPYLYIDYQTFLKNFTVHSQNFKEENLNIIDVHLRYRWWVREQMAFYKWAPIVCMTPVLFSNIYVMVLIPIFTVKMFDHYFQKFFLWRYRNKKVINVRNQFITKLSKPKNKRRRLELFEKIYPNLFEKKDDKEPEPPIKYIKFGEFSEYIFHAMDGGREQSSILQTTLFQNFYTIKNFFWHLSKPSNIWRQLVSLKEDFLQFRGDSDRAKYLINVNGLIDQPDVKNIQIFTMEDNLDHNIRRWSEIFRFWVSGSTEPSSFRLWEHTNFSHYADIYESLRYNCKDNKADLCLYYSLLAVPKLLNVIFKRR